MYGPICLDPGHGGIDPGAVNGKRYEKDDVLKLAILVKKYLLQSNVDVVMTRENDVAVTIADRCEIANSTNCKYFLSIHRDAAGPTAYGISAWVHSRATTDTVNKAKAIQGNCVAVAPTYDRKVNKGTPQAYPDFGVNVYTGMASCLLELGFITNAQDNDRFDKYFDDYARAIASGICSVVGAPFIEDEEPKPDDHTCDWESSENPYKKAIEEIKLIIDRTHKTLDGVSMAR